MFSQCQENEINMQCIFKAYQRCRVIEAGVRLDVCLVSNAVPQLTAWGHCHFRSSINVTCIFYVHFNFNIAFHPKMMSKFILKPTNILEITNIGKTWLPIFLQVQKPSYKFLQFPAEKNTSGNKVFIVTQIMNTGHIINVLLFWHSIVSLQ